MNIHSEFVEEYTTIKLSSGKSFMVPFSLFPMKLTYLQKDLVLYFIYTNKELHILNDLLTVTYKTKYAHANLHTFFFCLCPPD